MNGYNENLCAYIADHYGMDAQRKQTNQELGELLQELNWHDDQIGEDYFDHLLEELADVQIMIEQVRVLHGITREMLDDKMTEKLERQMQRIKTEQEKTDRSTERLREIFVGRSYQ